MATSPTRSEVFYRESDGQPMGETTVHRDATIELIQGLQDWFADDPLAYVSGDEFLYWVEGQPRFNVSPDVWCVRGIDKTVVRKVYKTWLEGGRVPELVIEVTSKSTRREDRGKKFRIYQDDLKVREYFLFDPLGEYLAPPLQGHRLVDGQYRPIEPEEDRLPSEVLGLHLEAEGPRVRLYESATGRRLMTRLEKIRALEGERRAARDETINELLALTRDQLAALRTMRAELQQSESARNEAQLAKLLAEQGQLRAELENEKLRGELEALRAGKTPKRK